MNQTGEKTFGSVTGDAIQMLARRSFRSAEFLKKAKKISEFIESLKLPLEQNNELVDLLQSHVEEAEHTSFINGVAVGMDVMSAQKFE